MELANVHNINHVEPGDKVFLVNGTGTSTEELLPAFNKWHTVTKVNKPNNGKLRRAYVVLEDGEQYYFFKKEIQQVLRRRKGVESTLPKV